MYEMPGETPQNPVYMKIMGTDATPAKLVFVGLLTLAPVAVAILMQNPALRQQLVMRLWHSGEVVSGKTARAFEITARKCHMKYDLARL